MGRHPPHVAQERCSRAFADGVDGVSSPCGSVTASPGAKILPMTTKLVLVSVSTEFAWVHYRLNVERTMSSLELGLPQAMSVTVILDEIRGLAGPDDLQVLAFKHPLQAQADGVAEAEIVRAHVVAYLPSEPFWQLARAVQTAGQGSVRLRFEPEQPIVPGEATPRFVCRAALCVGDLIEPGAPLLRFAAVADEGRASRVYGV